MAEAAWALTVNFKCDVNPRPYRQCPFSNLLRSLTIDVAIRIGLLALLAYWSLKVIGPFETICLWSSILTVALYPVFNWLVRLIGSKSLAAAIITLLSLMIVFGPVTWLGFAMIGGIELLVKGIDAGQLAILVPGSR